MSTITKAALVRRVEHAHAVCPAWSRIVTQAGLSLYYADRHDRGDFPTGAFSGSRAEAGAYRHAAILALTTLPNWDVVEARKVTEQAAEQARASYARTLDTA